MLHVLCLCASLSVCWAYGETCKNGWTNRDAIWFWPCGPREPSIRWGCTLAPPGEYNWMIGAVRPLLDYFDHLLVHDLSVCWCMAAMTLDNWSGSVRCCINYFKVTKAIFLHDASTFWLMICRLHQDTFLTDTRSESEPDEGSISAVEMPVLRNASALPVPA